jgi:hypothetical protein
MAVPEWPEMLKKQHKNLFFGCFGEIHLKEWA